MPVAYAADNLAMLDTPVETLDYHLRLAPARNVSAPACLIWNYEDSANYRGIYFDIPGIATYDPDFGFEVPYRLVEVTHGNDSVLASGTFPSSYPTGTGIGFSAMLKVQPTGAAVCFGGGHIDFSLWVPFDNVSPGRIGYRCDKSLKELRNDLLYVGMPAPEMASFESVDELGNYIEASTDGREGLWMYLDRDTDPSKALLGGTYSLATVAVGDGSYQIVYLGGSRSGADIWQPLRVKGYLKPTIFRDHFDLGWLDAAGRMIDMEASATYEGEGTILRINLPMYGATMRFRKVIQ